MRKVRGAVRADLADIEDACAFAWVQFFRYQPDREGEWRAWLFRTAQREAWRLNAIHRSHIPIGQGFDYHKPGWVDEPADPRDMFEDGWSSRRRWRSWTSCRSTRERSC